MFSTKLRGFSWQIALKEPSGDCSDVLTLDTLEALSDHWKPDIVGSRTGWAKGF